MNFDYAIHSDFLIHWTGKDIDCLHDPLWHQLDKSKTNADCTAAYIKRLHDILKYGLWKLSESRKHAKRYGRLGIGVKRPFIFQRLGRPLVYSGVHERIKNDKFLEACANELKNADLLNFFKPMNSSDILNYDFYSESEWRIIYIDELLSKRLIIDPRDKNNSEEHEYFKSLTTLQQDKLEYLIPLDGWFSMTIYPSLAVKNRAQQDISNGI
jgi:hypothetical protein